MAVPLIIRTKITKATRYIIMLQTLLLLYHCRIIVNFGRSQDRDKAMNGCSLCDGDSCEDRMWDELFDWWVLPWISLQTTPLHVIVCENMTIMHAQPNTIALYMGTLYL